GFQGTWRDYILSPLNNSGQRIDLVPRRGKLYLGGRWGQAIEEASKEELRGFSPEAVRQILEILEQFARASPQGAELVLAAAEQTKKATKECLQMGTFHELPVWDPEDPDSD
ncbi:unnamed protein product, partial [Polarella glacialis]